MLTWAAPAAITYGTALDGTQLDASSSVDGKLVYTPAAGTVLAAGTQKLHVDFTPTDTKDYNAASMDVSITGNPAPLAITASSATITYDPKGSVPAIVPSYATFVNGDSATSLTTVPTCSSAAPGMEAGTFATSCSGAVDANYSITYVDGSLLINPAGSVLTWAAPAAITYGTALDGTQLNASHMWRRQAGVQPGGGDGAGGWDADAGGDFTPTDTQDYNPASGSVEITVKAPLTITADNERITYDPRGACRRIGASCWRL